MVLPYVSEVKKLVDWKRVFDYCKDFVRNSLPVAVLDW